MKMKKNGQQTGQLARQIVWAVGVLFLVALLFSGVLENKGKTEVLTWDALAKKIELSEVKNITVSGDAVQVTLKNDTKATLEKETESSVSEMLARYGVTPEGLKGFEYTVESESGGKYWMGMLLPILLPIVLMLGVLWWVFRQAKTGANQAFTFGKINVRLFAQPKDKTTFKDVAGLKEAKEELDEVVDFLKNPKKFLDMGAKIPRGVLLMGQPGTGKTLLARAVAGESNVPFFHLSASEFVEMFVGVGASRVRDLFATAKKAAPAIIFVDEIDAVGRERGTGLGGGHDEREQTLNQILVEMDGFDRTTNVIVMAATNRPDVLDAALLRPGRFDRRVVLDMPDIKDREEILKIHAQGKPMADDIDMRVIAVRTPGFAGADLANLVNEGAIFAARQGHPKITQENLLNSIEKVLLGPARRGRVISDKEKEVTAYHEAGHALVAAGLKDADPVHKISIISRGMAGGYTLKLPIEERRLNTRAQFVADLAVAFGGYVAELLMFKDITTGSSNDIKNATELAHRMVMQYGMSDKLGPRAFGKVHDAIFLGRELSTEKDYSENLGTVIDEEVNQFMNRALQAAKRIVATNKDALHTIARRLMEKETIEQEEFEKIVRGFQLKPAVIR